MAAPFVPKMIHFCVLGKPDVCCVNTRHVLCGHPTCDVWTRNMCCVDTRHVLRGHQTCAAGTPYMCCMDTRHVLCGQQTCAVWTTDNARAGNRTMYPWILSPSVQPLGYSGTRNSLSEGSLCFKHSERLTPCPQGFSAPQIATSHCFNT